MRPGSIAVLGLAFSICAAAQIYSINTIAGNAGLGAGYAGDTGSATSAQLNKPTGVVVDSAGNVYIADNGNSVIREVSGGVGGLINTVAGTGVAGFVDNLSALAAELNSPFGIALSSTGNYYISDTVNARIREVSVGYISTIAGSTPGFGGDSGAALSAMLNAPTGIAMDSSGNIYIADTGNHRIRRISSGIITTFAGTGTPGFFDASIATNGEVYLPYGVAVDSVGNVYIADTGNNRIRKVSGGIISTVVGNGTAGYAGDGGTATAAELNNPKGVAVDSQGNIYISDTGNNVIRKVSNGVITTIAGNGTAGFAGDGGFGANAELNTPIGIAVDPTGNFIYVADSLNNDVRVLTNAYVISSIPHFAAGGTYVTDFYVVNEGSQTATFSISFYDNNGNALSVPFASLGTLTTLSGTIPAYGASYFEAGSAASSTQIVGSGVIQANPSIVVQGLYRHVTAGNLDYEAGFPASSGSTQVEIAFDATTLAQNGNQIYTAIAIANLDTVNPATVACTARDNLGNIIPNAVTVPLINPLGHWDGFNFPALVGLRGTLDCISTTKISSVALRAVGDSIAALPVIAK